RCYQPVVSLVSRGAAALAIAMARRGHTPHLLGPSACGQGTPGAGRISGRARRVPRHEPALRDCPQQKLGAAVDAELVEDAAQVELDGLLADLEAERDLLVAQPRSDQLHDRALPRREPQG